jgi:hypothetical protein
MKRSELKLLIQETILEEGQGAVYNLISDSSRNITMALKMAKKNKKLKGMVPKLQAALSAINDIGE